MKLHYNEAGKNETVCGGRISGAKSTGKKQYFSVDKDRFSAEPEKNRCAKCNAHFKNSK